MSQKIENDVKRFRDIVRGQIKKDLKKYITKGEMITRQGKDKVSIPLPHIQLPKIRFGKKQMGGVGQGAGEIGDVVGSDSNKPGDGKGTAGDGIGDHALEVDVDLADLAKILGEELNLPNIQPKGKKTVKAVKDRYSSLRRVGPESLRQFKKTYINALKRTISSGTYNPANPLIIPEKADKRYRSWKVTPEPQSNAVIIYMMDVSGSMGEEQKMIVRIESFWIEAWIKAHYKNVDSLYIIHDAAAREVDQHTFYHTRESGGTMISSAYKLMMEIVGQRFSPSEWNIYPFHFSDGDNLSSSDSELCVDILKKQIIPASNQFSYGQVKSEYGTGEFYNVLKANFGAEEKVVLTKTETREEIYNSIKLFLGKGR